MNDLSFATILFFAEPNTLEIVNLIFLGIGTIVLVLVMFILSGIRGDIRETRAAATEQGKDIASLQRAVADLDCQRQKVRPSICPTI